MGLHVLVLKQHIVFLILSSAAGHLLSLWSIDLAPRPQTPNTQAPLIGQLSHTWASVAHRIGGQLCHVFSF